MGYALSAIADDLEKTTCTARWIARALGVPKYGDRRLATYLQRLVDSQGFPEPLPSLRGQELTEDATADSRWIRAAVEAWFQDRLPPAVIAAMGTADREAAIDDMDAAANNLHLVGRGQ